MSKNKTQSKLTFISFYIGFVVASLLGILIGTIIWIQKERAMNLIHINANQSALYTYIKNAHQPDNLSTLSDLLTQFPQLQFASIYNEQTSALEFQASQDRNSSWLSLPRDYHPSIWEISYYTQKIDRFTLATPHDGTMRVTLVFNLLSPSTILKITTLALSGVLFLLILTTIITALTQISRKNNSNKAPSATTQSRKVEQPTSSAPAATAAIVAYPETALPIEERDFFQENPDFSGDKTDEDAFADDEDIGSTAPTLDLFEESNFSEEDPTFNHDDESQKFTDLDISDLEITDFNQEELPKIDDMSDEDLDDLIAPSDLDFFAAADEESSIAVDEDIFLEPLESMDYPSDEPQEITFNNEDMENELFTEDEPHNSLDTPNDESPDDLEDVIELEPLTESDFFSSTDVNDTADLETDDFSDISPEDFDISTASDELDEQQDDMTLLNNETEMEDTPELGFSEEDNNLFEELPTPTEATDDVATEEELDQEELELVDELSSLDDEAFDHGIIVEDEQSESIKDTLDAVTNSLPLPSESSNTEEEISKEEFKKQVLEQLNEHLQDNKPLSLIFLQENLASDYFKTALDTYFATLLEDQSLNIFTDNNRYALVLTNKDAEESFTLLENLNKHFQTDDLSFVAGMSTNEERTNLLPTLLWKEAEQALERAMHSGDENALIAFKINKEKYSSLSLESSDE